jgi:MFS family permease
LHPRPESAQAVPGGDPRPRRVRLPAMLSALRHRNYRLFFFGHLISLIGTWMQSVAQGWLVLRLTDSPALLGLTAAMTSLPVLLFSLFAGTIADRFPKRTILLCTQTGALLLASTLAFLTLTGLVQVWHIMLLAVLLGTVNAFDAPTRQAFTVEMVGREDLLNAIALNSSIFNAARTVGPALAGILVALIGEGLAFALNAVSYVAVLSGLALMRLPPRSAPPSQPRGSQLQEGLGYIAGNPHVRALLIQAGAIAFFGFAYLPLMPVFARDVLQAGPSGLGWLMTSVGAGSLLSALGLAQFGRHLPRGRILSIALLLHPLMMIGFTTARVLPLAMVLLFFAGMCGVAGMALTNTLLQSIVPDALRGRVMSVYTLLLMGLSPLGGMNVGGIAEFIGSVPFAVAGSAGVAWLIIAATQARNRFLREL